MVPISAVKYVSKRLGARGAWVGDFCLNGISPAFIFHRLPIVRVRSSHSCGARLSEALPSQVIIGKAPEAFKPLSPEPSARMVLLMGKILHDLKDSKLWELWYISYYG